MKKIEIKAFNIQEAFELLKEDEGLPSDIGLLISKNSDLNPTILEDLKGNYVLGHESYGPGENSNKSQFSTVSHNVHKGTKKWLTKYMIVYDAPNSTNLATKEQFNDKGSAVNKAREITEKECRSTYIILGKSPEGFSRNQASINYKPSQKQKLGLYKFLIL